MNKITKKSLVINAGSSSVKFQVFEDKTEKTLISGIVEEIGGSSKIKIKRDSDKMEKLINISDHKEAFNQIISILKDNKLLEGVSKVIHRTVHGGEKFKEPIIINKHVVEELKKISSLAPLHNPPNILGIELMSDLLPKIPQIAIFDTSFHSTISQEAYLYGLPYSYYREKGIRKYGFHGSSHQYVINEAIKILNNKDAKIISCHLGNGASVCASIGGKSVDTSMGMTPLEGNIMGTRAGSIDPGIVLHLITEFKMKPEEVSRILNKESGIKGLSGKTNDMREIISNLNNPDYKRALEVYLYRLVQIIGAYLTSMSGVDAIIFTGGAGENNPIIRKYVADKLNFLGVKLDEEKNNKNELVITKKRSKISFFVIPTNEELQMVRNAKKLIK
jgi:acetate kinase